MNITQHSKKFKFISTLNSVLKFFVYFTLFWILVKGIGDIEIPIPDISSSEPIHADQSEGPGLMVGNYLPTWKIFRNFGYLLAIFIFICEGIVYILMNQAREAGSNHIIVLTKNTMQLVILLTFSYAIAGLAVDSIYLAYFMGRAIY